MKKLTLIVLVLVLLLVLSGCGKSTAISGITAPELIVNYRASGISGTGVFRFIDKEAGVVCWISGIGYAYSISCLPIKDTLLDGK